MRALLFATCIILFRSTFGIVREDQWILLDGRLSLNSLANFAPHLMLYTYAPYMIAQATMIDG